jgi:hypothetical protein
MEKSNELFNIEQMALIVKKTPAEIKFALGIPLDKKCHARTRIEARKLLSALDKDSDPEETMAAFKCWVDLFLKDVESAISLGQAIDLLGNCPACEDAQKAIFKKIADFCGVTKENHFRLKIASPETTLKEIFIGAFDFMPTGSKFLSPSGKIQLVRNSLPVGSPMVAEIIMESVNPIDRKFFASAQWGSFDDCPKINPRQDEEWIKEW